MFGVIAKNLKKEGRFIGVTTDAHDPWVKEDKKDFYGIDVDVLEKEYVAPDTGLEVSICMIFLKPFRHTCTVAFTLRQSRDSDPRTGRHQSARDGALRPALLLRRLPVPERGVRALRKRRRHERRMEAARAARRRTEGLRVLGGMGSPPDVQPHRGQTQVKVVSASGCTCVSQSAAFTSALGYSSRELVYKRCSAPSNSSSLHTYEYPGLVDHIRPRLLLQILPQSLLQQWQPPPPQSGAPPSSTRLHLSCQAPARKGA